MFDVFKKKTPPPSPASNGVRYTMTVYMGSQMNFRHWVLTSDITDEELATIEPSGTRPYSPFKQFYEWYRDEATDRTRTFAFSLTDDDTVIVFDRNHIVHLHFAKKPVVV